jgi:hypothetical protein
MVFCTDTHKAVESTPLISEAEEDGAGRRQRAAVALLSCCVRTAVSQRLNWRLLACSFDPLVHTLLSTVRLIMSVQKHRVFVAGAGITAFNQPGPSRLLCHECPFVLPDSSIFYFNIRRLSILTFLQPRICCTWRQGRRGSSSQRWPHIAQYGCRCLQVRLSPC